MGFAWCVIVTMMIILMHKTKSKKQKLVKIGLSFLFLCLFSGWSDVSFGRSFVRQANVDLHTLNLFFPAHPLKSVSRISVAKLSKPIRPDHWPDRIPFAICLDRVTNKVFFNSFQSYLQNKLVPIENGANGASG